MALRLLYLIMIRVLAGWYCWAAARRPRMWRSWCSVMRSWCCGARSPGPGWIGSAMRSWRRWPGCRQLCCAPPPPGQAHVDVPEPAGSPEGPARRSARWCCAWRRRTRPGGTAVHHHGLTRGPNTGLASGSVRRAREAPELAGPAATVTTRMTLHLPALNFAAEQAVMRPSAQLTATCLNELVCRRAFLVGHRLGRVLWSRPTAVISVGRSGSRGQRLVWPRCLQGRRAP